MKQLNKEQIVSIKIYTHARDRNWIFKPADNPWWCKPRPDRIVLYIGNIVKPITELKRRYVRDGKVYYFPHIEIYTSDSGYHIKWFKTEDELNSFYEKELSYISWLNDK